MRARWVPVCVLRRPLLIANDQTPWEMPAEHARDYRRRELEDAMDKAEARFQRLLRDSAAKIRCLEAYLRHGQRA